ncbi:MAG: response regulator [Acidobacteriota bacterium]|nr:response regulator [Acidobacteriota bacterium]
MSVLPALLFGALLLCVGLFAVVALRLVRQARRRQDELVRLTEELERSRQDAAFYKQSLSQRSSLDTVKDEFISNVSHELRTPLTSIRGALGLLSAGLLGEVDAKAHNLLRIASTNTERLIRLINDILDLERMESGRAPLAVRRCSVLDLAREAVETMAAMADGAQIRLDLHCYAARDLIYFDADPDRILQVLTNLLSNAIKFSPADTTVSIQIDGNADSLLLKVVDEGRGIPADKLESVFDRFQQVESADASRKGGTGLGLAICRSIVQQHNGAIWAQPNQGAPGTTLWVQFSRSARSSDATAPTLLATPVQRGSGRILVCDDDPGIRVVVAEQLRQHGYDILEARSGEEAIAIASRLSDGQPISAILLDLTMPGLSGWETLEKLRESASTALIPVVILSVMSPSTTQLPAPGRSHPEHQGWVQKPFNKNLLLAELGRVLEQRDGPGQVLLVEDDEDLARVILAGFEDCDLVVDHAATRQRAVERCLSGPPDLLILDLNLPDGDGFSFVDWLRRQPALRSLPLIVYSGREISEDEMVKLRLGPTQFLTKARVNPQEIEQLVLTMVQRLRKPVPTGSAELAAGR